MDTHKNIDHPTPASLAVASGSAFSVGLYGESGGKPGVVLFLADDKDWDSRHLNRHGARLAVAPATPECVAYRDAGFRARSLHYCGLGRQDAAGLGRDLVRLGFDEATRSRFIHAAARYWPNVIDQPRPWLARSVRQHDP